MPVAIVLSGGGAQGDFEVGALRYLHDRGVRPDIVCGTSVGSINGTAVAFGEGGLEILETIWRGLVSNDDMYLKEPWFADFSLGVGGDTTDLGLAGYVLLPLPFPLRVIAAVIVKGLVDKVSSTIDYILHHARSIYNLEPIGAKIRDVVLKNWLTLDPASRKGLTAVLNQDGTLQVFARLCDKSVSSIAELIPNGLTGWGAWQAYPSIVANSHIAVGVYRNGSLEILVRGTDNAYYEYSEQWDAWVPFSQGWVFLSDPVIARNQDGHLEVFARGTDNAIWHRWEGLSGGWSDWASFNGNVSGDPVIGTNQSGALELFAKGWDHQLYHVKQLQPNDGWGTWEDDLGSPDGAITSNIAVGNSSDDGALVIFSRGMDKGIWYRSQAGPNGPWAPNPWKSLDGGVTSDPAVAQNHDGTLEVFALGADRALYHNQQTGSIDQWSGWSSLGGACTSDPVVARNQDDRLEVFVKMADDSLFHIWQQAPGGNWSSWGTLGGCIWPGIKLRIAMVSLNSGKVRYVTEAGMFLDNISETVDLADAVMASSAIPVVYPAVQLNNQWYVDAGIREVLPIQAAIEAGADTIYAIAANKVGLDYTFDVDGTLVSSGMRAAVEIMPDEIMRAHEYPRGGWPPGTYMITPSINVNDGLTIEPGLIRIAMAYGFMRANDIIGPFNQGITSQMLSSTSDDITSFRMSIWETEFRAHTATGQAQDNALPGPDYATMAALWTTVRNMKKQLWDKVANRRDGVGGSVPADINDWWNNWEAHNWARAGLAQPFAPTPWVQVTLGDIVVPADSPPPPL